MHLFFLKGMGKMCAIDVNVSGLCLQKTAEGVVQVGHEIFGRDALFVYSAASREPDCQNYSLFPPNDEVLDEAGISSGYFTAYP